MFPSKISSSIRKRNIYVLSIMNYIIGGIINGNISHFQTVSRYFYFKEMHFLFFFLVFFSPIFSVHSYAFIEIGTEIIAAKTADALRILIFTNIFE